MVREVEAMTNAAQKPTSRSRNVAGMDDSEAILVNLMQSVWLLLHDCRVLP